MKLKIKMIFLFIFLLMGLTPNLALNPSRFVSRPTEGAILKNVALDPAIFIDGNDQLATFAASGDGTKNEPYLIANYNIATASSHGVEIRNTTKYFILRNVTADGTGSSRKYGFSFTNVTHGRIESNIARHWTSGFRLVASSHNTLTDNTASTNNWDGFELSSSSHNTLTGNTAHNNSLYGFWLEFSKNNTLTDNTGSKNYVGGFVMVSSNNSMLTGNSASTNTYDGFWLGYSSHNTLTSNTASNNQAGGFVLWGSSHFNTLTSNTASTNTVGFKLTLASNNLLYLNRIRSNGVQATSDAANKWHNGTHGNYWSDYTRTDSNNDGIRDPPYLIAGGNNADPFPLMLDPVSSSETQKPSTSSPGWILLVLIAALALISGVSLARRK